MRASRRDYSEIIKCLLEAGADTDVTDQYGATALIGAAAEGQTTVARLLLEAEADVHSRDRNGWTALMWASSVGNAEMVELLKTYGAQ
jgi:ankyrin repeat protein